MPGRRPCWPVGGQRYLRRLRKSALAPWARNWRSRKSAHADVALKAKVKELEKWEQSKDSVDTRWVLTWKGVDGMKTAKAGFVAQGYQDPDLREGNMDIAGCASRMSSQLQLISLMALENRPIWSQDIKNAFSPSGWL